MRLRAIALGLWAATFVIGVLVWVASPAGLVEYYGAGTSLVLAGVGVALVVAGWRFMRRPARQNESAPTAVTTGVASDETTHSPTATTRPDGPLAIRVAGAVIKTGVYELPPGGRVLDAIEAAGGSTADADLDAVDLAAPLADGARVQVPATDRPVRPSARSRKTEANETETAIALVDVNREGPSELERLPGIGPSIAAAIVEERERDGPFASIDELSRVRGIGPTRLEALRPLVAV